jgi:hypothetical protein
MIATTNPMMLNKWSGGGCPWFGGPPCGCICGSGIELVFFLLQSKEELERDRENWLICNIAIRYWNRRCSSIESGWTVVFIWSMWYFRLLRRGKYDKKNLKILGEQ